MNLLIDSYMLISFLTKVNILMYGYLGIECKMVLTYS